MKVEFEKVDLLHYAQLLEVLTKRVPCYDSVTDSVRVRMCRSCSDLVIDSLADFAILHLRRPMEAPEALPHEDPLKEELEYLPY